MLKTYLYLLKRDRKNVKVLGLLKSHFPILPTIIKDVRSLEIGKPLTELLEKIALDHRIEWDLFLETAPDYKTLGAQLLKRGVVIPPSNSFLVDLKDYLLPKTFQLKQNNRVMIRRQP